LNFSFNVVTVIISIRLNWVEHVARLGEVRNSYYILVGKLQRKRPLGRSRCRWEDNIKSVLDKLIVTGWSEFI
jgi:hypothetical protein